MAKRRSGDKFPLALYGRSAARYRSKSFVISIAMLGLWFLTPYVFIANPGDAGPPIPTTELLPIADYPGGSSLAAVLTVVGTPTLSMYISQATT